MTIPTILSVFFTLTFPCLAGQNPVDTKIFYTHVQICTYAGTKEKDYVIEILRDSIIRISIYTSSRYDQSNSVLRTTYVGTISATVDTIKINYTDYTSDLKSKHRKTKGAPYINKDNFVSYPCAVFVLKDTTLVSTDHMFPTLTKSTFSITNQLNVKFNSWDKSVASSREIFGLAN